MMVGKQPWASLPPRYQAALRYAGNYAVTRDAGLVRRQERPGDRPPGRLGHAAFGAAGGRHSRCCCGAPSTVLDEEASGQREQFKKILGNWRQFRAGPGIAGSRSPTRAPTPGPPSPRARDRRVYRTDARRR